MGIIVKASLQMSPGSYPSVKSFDFENQEEYNEWTEKHNTDHRLGKIIGIHSEEIY